MKTIILLTIEDIETSKFGNHYIIKFIDGTEINFTPEAFYELEQDIKKIRKHEKNDLKV